MCLCERACERIYTERPKAHQHSGIPLTGRGNPCSRPARVHPHKSHGSPALLGCTTWTKGCPFFCQGFFFSPPYMYCNVVHSSQCVCVRVWYEVLEGISWDDRVSLSGFDKHSYILRNSLTCCRGHRPSCLFPVKLLICKQTQCLH